MHRSRAPSIAPDTFFVAQSWADPTTDMPGFNLRQAQGSDRAVSANEPDRPGARRRSTHYQRYHSHASVRRTLARLPARTMVLTQRSTIVSIAGLSADIGRRSLRRSPAAARTA